MRLAWLVLLLAACGDDDSGKMEEPTGGDGDETEDPFGNAGDGEPRAPSEVITPGKGGDECLTEWAPCSTAPTSCCSGLDCVQDPDPDLGTRCRKPCSGDGACDAACVEPAGVGETYCAYPGAGGAPLPEGECVDTGGDCDQLRPCCSQLVCVIADNAEFDGCRDGCATDDDCDSGCCKLFPDRAEGFCADARYCGCGMAGATCGGFEPNCCDGFVCTLDSPAGDASCKPSCQENADCQSECCVAITGTSNSACVAAERCGG